METTFTDSTKAVEHFVQLARRGGGHGASSGEVRARALAEAFLEHAWGLDEQAIEGAAEFLRRVPMMPTTAELIIRGTEGAP